MFFKVGSLLFYAGGVLALVALVAGLVNGATLLSEGVQCFPFRFLDLGFSAVVGAVLWAVGCFMRLCVCLGEAAKCFD